jgi:6-phosphogluconate dehydrogenase
VTRHTRLLLLFFLKKLLKKNGNVISLGRKEALMNTVHYCTGIKEMKKDSNSFIWKVEMTRQEESWKGVVILHSIVHSAIRSHGKEFFLIFSLNSVRCACRVETTIGREEKTHKKKP